MDWDAAHPAPVIGGDAPGQPGMDERRHWGQYFTPPALVEQMLEWVGYRPEAELEPVTLLDPACGTGNFLVAAAERLIAHGQARGWAQARLLAALQTNLSGIEADPRVGAEAEARLQVLAASLKTDQPLPQAPLDASTPLRFQLRQEDALALPAEPRYQLVLSNPPYLSSRKYPPPGASLVWKGRGPA